MRFALVVLAAITLEAGVARATPVVVTALSRPVGSPPGCEYSLSVTDTSRKELLSCDGRTAMAQASANGNGTTFTVRVEAAYQVFPDFSVTAGARAVFAETYIATGAVGAGLLRLGYAASCGGGNFAFASVPSFSVSNGTVTEINNPNQPCFQPTAANGVLWIPFEFGVTTLRIVLDTGLPFAAGNERDSYGWRSGTAQVNLYDSAGTRLQDVQLTLVPEPSSIGLFVFGACALARVVSWRRA